MKTEKMRCVKMKVSYTMQCVLECIDIKVVPEIHFEALLKLEATSRTIHFTHYLGGVLSCAKPMVLWCKSGLCTHLVHTLPNAKPSMIHRVLSPIWKKVKKLAVTHSTWQLTASPSQPVPHSHKCLTFPSTSQRHSGT